MKSNAESYLALSELGSRISPYAPTHDLPGNFINPSHEYFSTCPTGGMGIAVCIDTGIAGYLQRADALKIYELAFFSDGDVLELGTHKGLSTSIIALALHDRGGPPRTLETVDIDGDASGEAQTTLTSQPGRQFIHFNVADAAQFMDLMIAQRREFGFIFIDHWHGYEATRLAALRVDALLKPGGFVLFHDYNDPANADPAHVYGVWSAVDDIIAKQYHYEFFGNFGCCGLFRKAP